MDRAGKWRYLASGLLLWVLSGMSAQADSLDAQRQRYQEIKQAWDKNQMDVVNQLMPTLRDYPLYPYLEYRQLTQNMNLATAQQITAFMQANPTLPPARNLPARFISELAQRQDWKGILSFSPQPPNSLTARCDFYYAKLATGQTKAAWQGASEVWLNGDSLPALCDKLLDAWREAGLQTRTLTLQRMQLALKAGNTSLVNYLAKQLPASDRTLATNLATVQRDPQKLLTFALNVPASDFSREATLIIFPRLLKTLSVDQARGLIPQLVRAQKMSAAQRQDLEDSVAWRLMGNDITPEQAAWRDQVIARDPSVSLLERRVRLALGNGDRKALVYWLARLPASVKEKDEWRYWQAVVLQDQGQRQEGNAILRELLKERGFYPMAAAQRLGVAYNPNINIARKPTIALTERPEIARVRELMYWHMDNLARSEWRALVAASSKPEQEALSRYAFEQKWADLSVQATIVAKLWDHLEERFPLAWSKEFAQATDDKGITPSYAMAIARQESAWNPEAQSSVGAAGLMQVMPTTAEHTAKMNNLTQYTNSNQLLDPQMNILIGTHYLEYVYQMFGRNRILSTAAYNAGPGRVTTWLGNSDGRVDAVAFIESIPFSETRNYVKNVLAYDVFYRYFMQRPTKLMNDAEWQRRY